MAMTTEEAVELLDGEWPKEKYPGGRLMVEDETLIDRGEVPGQHIICSRREFDKIARERRRTLTAEQATKRLEEAYRESIHVDRVESGEAMITFDSCTDWTPDQLRELSRRLSDFADAVEAADD